MSKNISHIFSLIVVVLLSCQKTNIPITTNSDKARQLFNTGQEFMDKLRVLESIKYFEQATELDSNFAMAYLNLSIAVNNAVDRLKYLDKAKSKFDYISRGEQLYILAFEAGIMGRQGDQRSYFEELIDMYPDDARARLTLGNLYFGNQEYDLAMNQYKIAAELNPELSQIYNQLGYCYRFLGDYARAEAAFKKYIAMIPNDPNPYDSYAELLLEMGEYEVSIENYEKALSLDPTFANSYLGIATNLNLKDEHQLARKKLKELYYRVDDSGVRRQTLGAIAISFIDEGNFDAALKTLEQRLQNSTQIADTLAMVGDNNLIGVVYIEFDELDQAQKRFERMLALVDESSTPQEIKVTWHRVSNFQFARLNLKRGDLEKAWEYQKQFLNSATEASNLFQIRAAHELSGMLLLQQKQYDEAITELEKTNLQNPYNLYRLGLVYKAKGDLKFAREYFERAANANALNNFGYAFVRQRALNNIQEINLQLHSTMTNP